MAANIVGQSNVVNQVAYLRTTRNFPEELHQLTVEVNRAYLDTAQAVNNRTIGIFPTNVPAIGGESWFITRLEDRNSGKRQQNLRQVYTFTSTTPIQHNLNFNSVERFTKCQGSYTDGSFYYGVIFGSSVAIAGQVSFYIDPVNINILSGPGAPAISSGTIVLEWLSNV